MEKSSFLDFLQSVMTLFGVSVLILTVLTLCVGDMAASFSTLFALGSAGISWQVLFEYLGLITLISGLRLVFFGEQVIKNMNTTLRIVCMGASCVGLTVLFIAAFGWFPVDMWQPWVMMLICFSVCFAVSAAITSLKEKSDTKKLQEALRRLQRREEKQDGTCH